LELAIERKSIFPVNTLSLLVFAGGPVFAKTAIGGGKAADERSGSNRIMRSFGCKQRNK
jgi:hypothetical protein